MTVKIYNIFPRLLRQEGIAKIESFQNIDIHSIIEASNLNQIDLQNYIYSPIGGHKIRDQDLLKIKNSIISLAKKFNYPNFPSQKDSQKFDVELTQYLINNLQISPNEASKNELWNFLSCDLMPEVVHWRFFHKREVYQPTKEALIDRYLGGRRNCFQRLWWRAFCLRDLYKDESDSMIFLSLLESDDIREFEERTTIIGNISLWREMVIQYIETRENFKNDINFKKRDLLRDCIKRVIRTTPWLSFESLHDNELKTAVTNIFSDSLIALGLNPKINIESRPQKKIINDIIEKQQLNHLILDEEEKLEEDNLINKKKWIIEQFEDFQNITINVEQKIKTMFSSLEDTRLVVFVSKRYERKNQKYWFSITTQHREFLGKGKKSFILLGGSDKDYFFVIPFKWFQEREDYFNKSFFENGDKIHLYIEDEYDVNSLILSKNSQRPMENIDNFKLPKINEESLKVITESELVDPAKNIIRESGNEGIDTSELIRQLRLVLKPEGKDLKTLKGRNDDVFSQKVRNLKSHHRLENIPNIRFINNKFKWIEIIEISKNSLSIPRDAIWKKNHYIRINKEKILSSGGEKAKNQWEILKQFNKSTISKFQEKAMNETLNSPNSTFQSSNWWDREIDYCLQRRIISLLDKDGKEIKL